ncbi:MAG: hypothetical protein ABH849_02900 [Nanoarchaeota archaeon]
MTEPIKNKQEFNPIVDSNINLSKDGKYLIHRITITTIKPVNFIKKVLEG